MHKIKYFKLKKNNFRTQTLLKFIVAFALLMSSTFIQAQILEGSMAREIHPNIEKIRVIPEKQALKNIYFDEAQQPDLANLPNVFNEALSTNNAKTTNDLTFEIIEDKVNKQGLQQVKYQQYYNGIPIEGALCRAQVNEDKVEYVTGRLYKNVDVSVMPQIAEEDIVKYVKKHFEQATLPYLSEDHIQGQKSAATPTLVILKQDKKDYLCWKLQVNNIDGPYKVFIDAHIGTVINTISLYRNCAPASGETTVYGYQDGVNTSLSFSDYVLHNNTCNEVEVHVKDWDNDYYWQPNNGGLEYLDFDNYWNDDSRDRSAFQTYWILNKVLDFFETEFGRNSYDDDGSDLLIYNEAAFYGYDQYGNIQYYGSNASWSATSPPYILAGYGEDANDGTDDHNSADLMAHEFTHGVTEYSAALNYWDESGALNESFSDIFGTAFEFWLAETEPSVIADWTIYEDVNNVQYGNTVYPYWRNMANPNDPNVPIPQPDTYLGYHWDNYGDVHTNSGVQNFWFYLLVNGGTGVNDNGDGYSVTGIGMDKAMEIVYKTLTEELVDPDSDYLDARTASMQAAIDLFTNCSTEYQQVMNAWHAVGVGNASNCSLPDLTVINASVSHNPVSAGTSLTATCNVKNIGDAPTDRDVYLGYFLSDDNTYSGNDTYLGYNLIPNLGVNAQSSQQSFTFTIPNNVTGIKYLLCQADTYDLVAESNENNNLTYIQIDIQEDSCLPRPAAADIQFGYPCNATSLVLKTTKTHAGKNRQFRYREFGTIGWTETEVDDRNISVTGLKECTRYNVQLKVQCENGFWSEYSPLKNDWTKAARPLTSELDAEIFCSGTGGYLHCFHHDGDTKVFRYKMQNESWAGVDWFGPDSNAPGSDYYASISGLNLNTQYQYQVMVKCGTTGRFSCAQNGYFTTPVTNPCKIAKPSNSFNVYPNPTKNLININLDVNETVETIRIFNLQGHLLKEWKTAELKASSLQLDLSELNTGVYMLRINDTHIEKITKL